MVFCFGHRDAAAHVVERRGERSGSGVRITSYIDGSGALLTGNSIGRIENERAACTNIELLSVEMPSSSRDAVPVYQVQRVFLMHLIEGISGDLSRRTTYRLCLGRRKRSADVIGQEIVAVVRVGIACMHEIGPVVRPANRTLYPEEDIIRAHVNRYLRQIVYLGFLEALGQHRASVAEDTYLAWIKTCLAQFVKRHSAYTGLAYADLYPMPATQY